MKRFTRRGFIGAAATAPIATSSAATPLRELVLFKSRSLGPTLVLGSEADLWREMAVVPQVPEHILTGQFYVDDAPPTTRNDLEQVFDMLREVRKVGHVRPDVIVIDGIGYGPEDSLPPPLGSGA